MRKSLFNTFALVNLLRKYQARLSSTFSKSQRQTPIQNVIREITDKTLDMLDKIVY